MVSVLTSCRCKCGHCIVMPTAVESVCCCEIDAIAKKMDETEADISCITEHEGLEPAGAGVGLGDELELCCKQN